MNRPTHAWIAIRSIALLADEGENEQLVQLLQPHATKAAIGAWIPDLSDAKRGGSTTENHILKMCPHADSRFRVDKDELLGRLGSYRQMKHFLDQDQSLSSAWWRTPYKGSIRSPGQHLANRAMALATTVVDLLLLGDQKVDSLLPGSVGFSVDLESAAKTTADQAALYLFMLSHFVADCCMPCHCDKRDLSDYAKGLHKELEGHWGTLVGREFDDDTLLRSNTDPDEVLDQARAVDTRFGVHFRRGNNVPRIKATDVWLEMINVCRASFAIASIIAPPGKYPYDEANKRAPFVEVFGNNESLLRDISRAAIQDAVLNTAMVWKDVWNRASSRE